VATESLAVLAATLATVRPSPVLAVAGTCWFALGLACYPPLTGLVGARLLSASQAAGLPATLRYGLGWWAMAFPLGMYAVATNDLGDRTGSGELVALAGVAFWIALASWLAVAVGLLRQGARWWVSSRQRRPGA
jgi:tellurite resistance protein TehA-like permease